MLLDSFFLRYRADTGQAVKDVDKLDKANAKMEKGQKGTQKTSKEASRSIQEDLKKTGQGAKDLGEQFGQMGVTGANAFSVMRGGASTLVNVLGSIGPAGLLAAAGIGAVIAAVTIANAGIEDARVAAEEAIQLGEKAFDARLAQGELIRLQNAGRRRGLNDEQVNQSAKATYDRSAEIRAAQRQAARDPASAFNNPLIKQAGLWKKAGVDVAAAMEVQVEQQNKYLRTLQERGEGERALVEGTQLFGRTLADVKSVVSATNAEIAGTALMVAQENELRRKLQSSSEDLATSEGKLDAERKKTDDRIRSQTVPAAKNFTDALTDWHRATQPLQEAWGHFVADMIEGLTSIVRWSTKFLDTIGLAEDRQGLSEREYNSKNELDELEANMRRQFQMKHAPRIGAPATEADKAKLEADIKAARDKRAAELAAAHKVEDDKRFAAAPANIKQAAEGLVKEEGGKRTFEGREVSDAQYSDAMAAVEEAIKSDPSIDTLEEIRVILSDQLAKVKEQGKVMEAQTTFTKKIEANTAALINTGLEQAMSLWAANVGKASGMGSGAFQGETRESYESRMRHAQRTINPNTARQVSEQRDTVGSFGPAAASNAATSASQTSSVPQPPAPASSGGGEGEERIKGLKALMQQVNAAEASATVGAMNTQAASLNKSSVMATSNSNTSSTRTVTVGDVHVAVQSSAPTSAGMAQDVGHGIKDELKYAVNEFADPRVS